MTRVLVIGAGISGAACAAALRRRGVDVTVRERGRSPGGRMSAPQLHGRRVDLGAAYFTVRDPGFQQVVDDWAARGLARRWTNTMAVLGDPDRDASSGPTRWAAPDGLRALIRDLHGPVELAAEVETLPNDGWDAVVLAMPDPQAARLAPDAFEWVGYDPVIAVAAGFTERTWSLRDAGFVNGDPDITLIVDDGSRRGDGAAVLVVHTTSARAAQHLDDPDAAVGPALTAAGRLLGLDGYQLTPQWTHAHRWTFAKPAGTHGDDGYGLRTVGDLLLGACGDSWCPSGAPRVEAAWMSGDRLGSTLANRLAA